MSTLEIQRWKISTDFLAIKQPFTQRDCIIHLESYPPYPCEEKKRPRHVEKEHKHFSAMLHLTEVKACVLLDPQRPAEPYFVLER